MTITQAATQAYQQLSPDNPFAERRTCMFVIDLDGNLRILGSYNDPDVGFDHIIDRYDTIGEFRYFGIECGGLATRVDENDEDGEEKQRAYIVAIVDRNLDVGVYSLFESRPNDPLIEAEPEGLIAEKMKSVMACLIMLRLTAG